MDTALTTYTVVVAISDPGAAVAARQLIAAHDRFEIMREVPNAVMSIDSCQVLKPDVLVVADDSPGLRGSEILGEVHLHSPDTKNILLAQRDAGYLRGVEHVLTTATLDNPDSITTALDVVAQVLDCPDAELPERRATDRRQTQDWSKVFAERRNGPRRTDSDTDEAIPESEDAV